jgi:starch synthase
VALRVAIVASEVAPFAKTGGLGDVTAALGRTLARRGHDVRTFLPLYGNLRTEGRALLPVSFLRDVPLSMGGRAYAYDVVTATPPRSDAPVYFVKNPVLYGRAATYTGDADEPVRFAFLSRAALECCQRMGWAPDVVHCNDWHTALIPLYLLTLYSWDRLFAATKTLLTIHNVGYQGSFGADVADAVDLGRFRERLHREDLAAGRFSFLKTGVLYADALSTVSETHAREMQTPEQGMGLDALLRARSRSFVGIVNGIDAEEWDPAHDPRIPFRYTASDLSGKAANKEHLLGSFGLPHDPAAPLIAIVSRLSSQKGFGLCMEVLPRFLAENDVRLVVLGTGERRFEEFFGSLERRFPTKARFRGGYSEDAAHRFEAAADLFLMPSLYEPCGLNQMYSQRYGTLPIVRRTGGLADTVVPWDPATGEGTGFVFDHYDAAGLRWGLDRALAAWRDRAAWRRLVQNAMAKDWSWDRQIRRYEALYAAIR